MQKLQSENSHSQFLGIGSGTNGGKSGADNDQTNMSQQHSVLNAFDFGAIDEMDPALGKK